MASLSSLLRVVRPTGGNRSLALVGQDGSVDKRAVRTRGAIVFPGSWTYPTG